METEFIDEPVFADEDDDEVEAFDNFLIEWKCWMF